MARERRSRRFLPADPRVEEPYRLTPQLALRVAILGFVALAVFAVLVLRLWALQVLSGAKYRGEASDNRVRTIQVDAQRGEIVDIHGHPLVENVLGWSLEVWPADLPKAKGPLSRELQALSVGSSIPVTKILAAIKPYAKDPLTPVVLRRGIHPDQIVWFRERQLEFPGVELAQTYLRSYPNKSLLAQVLGYVGPITQSELPAAKKEGYDPQDQIGQAGIEKSYDRYLRGTDGTEQLTVNSLGQPTSPITARKLPVQGNTLRLTINLKLQQAAEQALRYGITTARANGAQFADGGAIVALDPETGAVLAMASNPTYEPSVFVSRDPSKLEPLLDSTVAAADNTPGLNRAIDAFYPPGSTFKPVTALAAMEDGILSPTETLQCTPTFAYYQQVFKNWDLYVDQPMELDQALAESCDTYFYRVGALLERVPSAKGPTLQNWASQFGFGANTGIDIGPEQTGLLPTPDWLKATYPAPKYPLIDRIWKPGYEVQLAIGQGFLEVTPLQMADLYALIANGGKLVTPHLAEDVEQPSDAKGQPPVVLRALATQQPKDTGVDPAYISAVQQGLWEGTHSTYGTSYGVFGQFPVSIAGKTGSAEKNVSIPGYPHPLDLVQSWWCGYGPAETSTPPKIVVCAVIENGGEGASAAAPAAAKVLQAYFGTGNVATTSVPSD